MTGLAGQFWVLESSLRLRLFQNAFTILFIVCWSVTDLLLKSILVGTHPLQPYLNKPNLGCINLTVFTSLFEN